MKTSEIGCYEEAKSNFLSFSLPEKRQMGKVHSVFRNSFNIQLNGQLINFSRTGMSLSAYGCVFDSGKMEGLLNNLRPGDIVRYSDAAYTIYTEKGTVNLDTSMLAEVDLTIPDISDVRTDIVESGIYNTLKEVSFEKEIGLELDEQTRLKISCLRSVHRCGEKQRIDTVNFFIGRGKGLTPSGDDLLVGFALMRQALLNDSQLEKVMEKCLRNRLTTDISEAYYRAFIAGFVSSHLKQLIQLLLDENDEEAKELIYAIGQYGHTSGYDSLYGCYLGLESIINERRDNT